jgi:hypothetical protein
MPMRAAKARVQAVEAEQRAAEAQKAGAGEEVAP